MPGSINPENYNRFGSREIHRPRTDLCAPADFPVATLELCCQTSVSESGQHQRLALIFLSRLWTAAAGLPAEAPPGEGWCGRRESNSPFKLGKPLRSRIATGFRALVPTKYDKIYPEIQSLDSFGESRMESGNGSILKVSVRTLPPMQFRHRPVKSADE